MARSAGFSEARIPELAVRLATASAEQVAEAIDVHPATIRRWLRRGREEPGSIYGRLVEAVDAAGAGRGEALTREELVVLLERQARRGNVRAIQLLLERPWAKGEQAAPAGGLIDELAKRRAQR
jgi:transposase